MSGNPVSRSSTASMLGSQATDDLTDDYLSSGTHSLAEETTSGNYMFDEDEEVFSTQIIDKEILESRKKFTIYKLVVVTSKGRKYVIHRRYADFVHLNKRLRKLFPIFQLYVPPKRYVRNNFNQEFLRRREHGLQEFMQNILAHRVVSKSQPVKKFFRLNNPPSPFEDLPTCIMHNMAQEEKIRSLQCMVYNKESEIASLQHEIAQLHSGADHHHKYSVNVEETQSKMIKDYEEKIKHFEEKVAATEEKYRQAIIELERSKKQHQEEKQIVKKTRSREQDFRQAEVETKMKEYEGLLSEIRHQIDVQLKTFEFPSVNVNIHGQNFEARTADLKSGQLCKLKEDMEYLDVMMRRYNRASLEAMEHELVEMKSELAGKEHKITNLESELRKCRSDLSHLHLRCQMDAMNKTKKLEDLGQENARYREYTIYLEEHYFNSLVLGIKLGHGDKLSGIFTSAQTLYERQRLEQIPIQNWPQWIFDVLCRSRVRTTSRDQPSAPSLK